MSKPEVKRSHKFVREYLERLGAVQNTERDWCAVAYTLETPAGPLAISMHDDDGTCVFCQFDDPDKAVAVLGRKYDLNPYSGKWNMLLSSEGPILAGDVLRALEWRIERLLDEPAPVIDRTVDHPVDRRKHVRDFLVHAKAFADLTPDELRVFTPIVEAVALYSVDPYTLATDPRFAEEREGTTSASRLSPLGLALAYLSNNVRYLHPVPVDRWVSGRKS